jgi:EAL domain-containing protein (putative c-di-GMP-specific phosphodiesterase class I)/CheY-like chemotaxis protein
MSIAQRLPVPEKGLILLVDDNDGALAAMRGVLQRAGYHVVTCSSGNDALSALANQSFDVIVTDIELSGMTGLELLRTLRNRDLDLPVVLVTDDPSIQTASEAVEHGAFRYLVKPVPVAELGSVVDRAAKVGQLARSRRECLAEVGSGKFKVGDRIGVDAFLDRALSSLWMAYQPIVFARDSSLFAYEALLRAEEAMLPTPAAVLEAAERTGSLIDVGRAVRGRVLVDTRTVAKGPLIFVNLHPEELRDSTLYLPDSPFAALAPRVVLEITERMSLVHVPNVPERIASLRALGFRIALDDLGAGYAGLSSFAQLEPEYVKLDMSLIRDVHENPTKRKIIRSMVQLCHDLGRQIIAEGVELAEQRNTLIELECDFLQGHLFARPAKPFPELLR